MNQHSVVLSGPVIETLGGHPKAVWAWGPESSTPTHHPLQPPCRQSEQLGKAVKGHLS